MSTFGMDRALLRDAMKWDTPEYVVQRIEVVVKRHHLDKPCKVCGADVGHMCRTTGPLNSERAIIHTEREIEHV